MTYNIKAGEEDNKQTVSMFKKTLFFFFGVRKMNDLGKTDLKIGPYLLARTEKTSGPYLASKGRCPKRGRTGGPGTFLTPQ